MRPLDGIRVVDRTRGIAGGYCSKLLVDAGAEVAALEADDHPLRTWRGGALHEYLRAGVASVGDDSALLAGADLLLTEDAADLGAGPLVVTITPFGTRGPWVGRPATEFTLQAACGSMGHRGLPEAPPLAAGGRLGEWITGTYAAVAAVAALDQGERHVDVAMLDCMAVSMATYPSVFADMAGWPPLIGTGRVVEVPSVVPAKDGWVALTTNSATQFQDLLVLLDRADWLDDPALANATKRFARRDEFLAVVHEHTRRRTVDALLDELATFRIPAGPVLDGGTVTGFEQFVARQVFVASASGRLRQPRPPYRIGDEPAPAPAPVPEPRSGSVDWSPRPRAAGATGRLPLDGVRILDCTAWWAGPAATHVLATLGADVIKVESVTRPDPMRFAAVRPPSTDRWWEWGPIFHAANANKRGITLDLSSATGVDLFERLLVTAEVVVENQSPRVLEQFGLGWERVHAVNPDAILVRMPAFGLDGPWRDRTGFAQTMESITGMAARTGFPDGPPVLVRGACDPLAGMHAVLATLLALRRRTAGDGGALVESTMVEAALAVAVEAAFEHDLQGVVPGREGNRSEVAAPQGAYRCRGEDSWVALAVATDEQWDALRSVLGWSDDPRLATEAGRRADHDDLDHRLAAWFGERDADAAVDLLVAAGLPAATVIPSRDVVHNPQVQARGLFEVEHHPVTGDIRVPTVPFRFSSVPAWMRRPSPTLGEHNDEVLAEVAGPDELRALREAGGIGERARGA